MRLYTRPGSPFIWYDVSVAGDRLRGSSKCKTKAEARRVVQALIEERRQRRGAADEWRLRELTGAYWNDIGQHRKSETDIFRYLEALHDIIGPDKPVAEIDTALLLDYRARRRSWSGTGCSAVTVNRDLATLKAAMNHAVTAYNKAMPQIAWKSLLVKENPWRTRYASAGEFARIVEHAHPALRPMIVAAVTTGLRRGNILKLQWHQVDMDGGNITLGTMKSGKPHAVKMTGPLRAALSTLQPDASQRRGRVFDTTNYRKRWDACRAAAKVPDLRWHDLRHTFASWARLAGADLQSLMDAMDHGSIAMTMRYSHITPASDSSAFDKVASLLDIGPAPIRRLRKSNHTKRPNE
ncbi:MAG: site-specific integrase [Pseudomonadota bacterium]